jgi:hypothetical protein
MSGMTGQAAKRTDSVISGGVLTAGAAVGTRPLWILEAEARTYSYFIGYWFDSQLHSTCCP